jgi:preprotein translocase subunit SecY
MKKFIESISNVWKIEELKNRILITLGLLLVYRFGAQVTLPGIDATQLGNFLYFCFYCCSVNGNCDSIFAKTSK